MVREKRREVAAALANNPENRNNIERSKPAKTTNNLE